MAQGAAYDTILVKRLPRPHLQIRLQLPALLPTSHSLPKLRPITVQYFLEGVSMDFVKNFVVTGVIMGAFDAVWLSVIAKKFYRSQIGGLLLQNPNMLAALLFYIFLV
jgi:hypothetical protein